MIDPGATKVTESPDSLAFRAILERDITSLKGLGFGGKTWKNPKTKQARRRGKTV